MTAMHNEVSKAIQTVIESLMDNVMERVLVTDPFVIEKFKARKPLYAALVPAEIFKGSHFERRFVTPFGSVWEKLAVAVASAYHGHCAQGETVNGLIREERLQRIQEVLNKLEHRGTSSERQAPDWNKELKYILSGGGELIPVSVTCDILIRSTRTNKSYAFELKAPLPNSDQTKVSKEKIFKLLAMENPIDNAYYALVYNPYGKKEDYAWSFPMRWFDMKHDPSVLIGNEFWDLIGGPGTYAHFIAEVNKLGVCYKERIYTEYLGIEPPADFNKDTLS